MQGKARLFVAVLLCAAGSAQAGTVETTGGMVKGIDDAAVSTYYAIPYAAPPVGDLRWRAPQNAASWQGLRDATRPSAECYQGPPGAFGPYSAEFMIKGNVSEDCLYLNVWTPRKASGKLPVFFYIHGGGFGSGSGTIPVYEGRNLAGRGAVVVTINYRLGVFGFLAHPELTRESGMASSGNYGLLDMIAALKWVKANIARFGGDPDDVTISGQSAGAAAVNDLVLSPLAKGLFQRAIAQSGSGIGIRSAPLAEAEKVGADLAAKVHAVNIADLRKIDAATLEKLTNVPPPSTSGTMRMPAISFAPNNDGVVLAGDPGDVKAPVQSLVPFMTGFNADEALPTGEKITPAVFEANVKARYGAVADRLIALYPHATDAEAEASSRLLARDRYMANLVLWAEGRAANSGQPVYTYLFTQPYPSLGGKSFGSFHTAEVPYVMGALGKGGRVFTAADEAVSRHMQDHWLAFMKTGNPSLPNLVWPRTGSSEARVMAIGPDGGLRHGVSSLERFMALRDFVTGGGQLSLF
ncbi:carboxylesterase/lipase family protein [Novosphingobium sediminicola]|nr:carboxylesterase family protein [Novosphingobium sediminicola]